MPASRDPWLDNAKFWLVGLVVVGHAMVIAPPSDLRNQTYDFVYAFHMPAFILLSGYLSRRFRWTRRHITALVTTLLVPYVFFELSMAWWRVHAAGTVSSLDALDPLWVEPHWPTWFLLVLAMWRLVTPILVRHWAAIPISILISLGAGAWDFTQFDTNRFLGMLPFFVIGLHLHGAVLERVRARWTPLLGALVLGWLWWSSAAGEERPDIERFYYRSAYETMDLSFIEGVLQRSELLLIGVVATFAMLALVPRGRHFFTSMGAASMIIYLFHGFVVQWAVGHEWRQHLPEGERASVLVVVVSGFVLAMVLGSPWVSRVLNLLADPWNQVAVPVALTVSGRGRAATPKAATQTSTDPDLTGPDSTGHSSTAQGPGPDLPEAGATAPDPT